MMDRTALLASEAFGHPQSKPHHFIRHAGADGSKLCVYTTIPQTSKPFSPPHAKNA